MELREFIGRWLLAGDDSRNALRDWSQTSLYVWDTLKLPNGNKVFTPDTKLTQEALDWFQEEAKHD